MSTPLMLAAAAMALSLIPSARSALRRRPVRPRSSRSPFDIKDFQVQIERATLAAARSWQTCRGAIVPPGGVYIEVAPSELSTVEALLPYLREELVVFLRRRRITVGRTFTVEVVADQSVPGGSPRVGLRLEGQRLIATGRDARPAAATAALPCVEVALSSPTMSLRARGWHIILGREGDLAIDDPRVSRRHAIIQADQDGGCTIELLEGTSNGLVVNGVECLPGRPVPLRDGAVVHLFRAEPFSVAVARI